MIFLLCKSDIETCGFSDIIFASHARRENGTLTLSWTAAKSAVKHRVYFGTDSAAVLAATPSSTAVYKGEQSGSSYKVSGTTPLQTYYWRVDEVDANGTVTAGNVWSFKPGRVAFEGAEGYGRNAVGGRGGKVEEFLYCAPFDLFQEEFEFLYE